MALIKCPECGKEISDKAETCIHCGKIFVEEHINKSLECDECGSILSEIDEVCPKCGCPVKKKELDETKPQQVEVTNIKMTGNIKKVVIGIIIALVVCLGIGKGYKMYLDNQAEKEYQNRYNEYVSDLKQTYGLMLSGASDAESLCNLISRVWGNAIFKERDNLTDKYTNPKGVFVKDFNDALANLFADPDTRSTISSIENNQASVKEFMKELQNPPEGLDKCYETVSDLYTAYRTLTNLAINPSGNYESFNTDKSNSITDCVTLFEELDNQIPQETESK